MSLNLVQAKRMRNGYRIHVRRLLNEATELAGKCTDQNAEDRRRMEYYKSTLTKLPSLRQRFSVKSMTSKSKKKPPKQLSLRLKSEFAWPYSKTSRAWRPNIVHCRRARKEALPHRLAYQLRMEPVTRR